jgi:hypothetical protein
MECDPAAANFAFFSNCCCDNGPPNQDIGCNSMPADEAAPVTCSQGTFSTPFSGIVCGCLPNLAP